jgi:hypothetical protein
VASVLSTPETDARTAPNAKQDPNHGFFLFVVILHASTAGRTGPDESQHAATSAAATTSHGHDGRSGHATPSRRQRQRASAATAATAAATNDDGRPWRPQSLPAWPRWHDGRSHGRAWSDGRSNGPSSDGSWWSDGWPDGWSDGWSDGRSDGRPYGRSDGSAPTRLLRWWPAHDDGPRWTHAHGRYAPWPRRTQRPSWHDAAADDDAAATALVSR